MSNLALQDTGAIKYLQEVQSSLSNYLGRGNYDDFQRSALMMISESDQLQKCLTTDAGKKSLFHALKYGASTGLSLNPQEGKAALIAYNGNVQYQVMKNGLIELAMQSGKVKHITSDTVRENDEFRISKGVDGDSYSFSPARKNRGDIDGFFAAVMLFDGTCHTKYMTSEEMKAHRDKYSSLFKNKPSASPWSKSFEGMGLKTIIKSLFKSLSISPEMDNAIGSDDKSTFEVEQQLSELKNVTEKPQSKKILDELEESDNNKPTPNSESNDNKKVKTADPEGNPLF